jgi:hypothetical protein
LENWFFKSTVTLQPSIHLSSFPVFHLILLSLIFLHHLVLVPSFFKDLIRKMILFWGLTELLWFIITERSSKNSTVLTL